VRTDQTPSSTKFQVRPRCAHRPMSELDRAHQPSSELDRAHRPSSELDRAHRPSSELDQVPSLTKVCAPTKVRARLCAPTKLRARPTSEFDQGVRTDQGPSSTNFRVRPRCAHRPRSPSGARPRCAHRPRSPSGARPRCAHRPSSELDQVPSSTKVCAPTKVPFRSSTVRTDQGPSSIKVRAGPFAPSRVRFRSSTKFRVRPRCAPRPRSELDQGPSWTVRTVQGPSLIKVRAGPCAPSRVRAQPSSEFDQGVHPDQGPSSTKVG